jgi:UDP-GlcNAc:undecaprenyl-phosphate GlcNAc-1-phosphate transferase
MIRGNVAAAAGGFVLVLLLVPVIEALCVRWELYDRPGPLKIHTKPIPRLGGIAVTVAILGAILVFARLSVASVLPLVAAMILLCFVGAVDDIRGLSAATRLTAQVVAGAILWCGGGCVMILRGGLISLAATCILTVAFVNALNLIDGADGIAGGVAAVIAVFYGVVPWASKDHVAPIVAWALAGSCTSFLLFNFPMPVARIFLGDGGSTVIGLSIAFLALHFYGLPGTTGRLLLFPLVLAALPLLDMVLAIARRARGRASPFFGDRCHFNDVLASRGCTPRATALICYGITTGLGFIGFAGMWMKATAFLILAGLCVGAFLVAAILLGELRPDTSGAPRPARAFSEAGK